jgi:hypothetical protein
MKNLLLITFGFLITLCIHTTAFSQTKEQTVAWLNKYGNKVLKKYYEGADRGEDISLIVDQEGKVKITKIVNTHPSLQTAYLIKDLYIFNLEDIDPLKIEIGKEFSIVCSSTKCMEWSQDALWGEDPPYTDTRSSIRVHAKSEKLKNDPNIVRFRKALKHAIKLYGGTSVKEDLFDE